MCFGLVYPLPINVFYIWPSPASVIMQASGSHHTTYTSAEGRVWDRSETNSWMLTKPKKARNTYTHLCNMTHSKDIMAKGMYTQATITTLPHSLSKCTSLITRVTNCHYRNVTVHCRMLPVHSLYTTTHIALAALFVNTSACTSYPSYSHIKFNTLILKHLSMCNLLCLNAACT